MINLKLKEIMWEEIDEDLWKNNPKEAERREYYLPFYRSLEKRLIDRINEMLPTIKEAAEFVQKHLEFSPEVQLFLFEVACPYEGEFPYHDFGLCIWGDSNNEFYFEVRDFRTDIAVAYLDIEPYECYAI
ncbi:MAG: hypothetical protein QXQ64_08090 [Candidatus Bathyarchaeia archaeon]